MAETPRWLKFSADLEFWLTEMSFFVQTIEEENIPAPVETAEKETKDVSALLADLKEALAEVTNYDDSIDEVYNDLDDKNPSALTQKDRLAKENKSKYNIEQHNFR